MTNNQDQETYSKGEVLSMLESIDDGIKVIGEQHEDLTKNIKEINGRLDRIESDVVDIKHELKHKVDHEEFEKLENRVIKLEKSAVVG